MNKGAIQRYAVWARNELIEQIKQRTFQYEINEKGYGDANIAVIAGRVLSESEKRQRAGFVELIKRTGYSQAIEEVAYTWFNRFVALRYMEVNDYLPTHTRVFSDANGAFNPEILKDVLHLELPGLDRAKVSEFINANATDDLYRYLLLTQCNALNDALPEMFERMGGYTEILLPNNILRQDSVLGRLVTDIPEEDWCDAVQIIGWMYQYYNTEPKQAVFDGLKKNVKITKEKIPAATQLFTPDWIVRYMVENSLGRLWLEGHPNAELKANWKYYLDEAEQTPEVAAQLEKLRAEYKNINPEDIKVIDPCMGSGHILVYAFDVLIQIYRTAGYADRDAAKLILEKNLYGLDIDRRAYQLSYFSLMMKARQYNRRVFTENVAPQVYHPAGFVDGEEYGSLLKVDDPGKKPEPVIGQQNLFDEDHDVAIRIWNFKRLLALKYDVVVTNPPYMGSGGMNGRLAQFVKDNYPDSKSDLFAVFIEKCGELMKPTGFQAMITQHAWMFLSSYEILRSKLRTRGITNMAHLGARAFAEIGGEVVQSTAFVLRAVHINDYKGSYVRLVDINDADEKERTFLNGDHRYTASADNFAKIPGSPVAYWVSDSMRKPFETAKILKDFAEPRQGMATTDNNRFLRLWYEIIFSDIGFSILSREESIKSMKRWFPYNKGGDFRKWYGNNEYIVDYFNDGKELIDLVINKYPKISDPEFVIKNRNLYFRESITWTFVSSSSFGVRYSDAGFIFDVGGSSVFPPSNLKYYLLGFLCSKLSIMYMQIQNPTLNFQVGNVATLPIIVEQGKKGIIENLVDENISLSRDDWDSFEASWDFKRHPLV